MTQDARRHSNNSEISLDCSDKTSQHRQLNGYKSTAEASALRGRRLFNLWLVVPVMLLAAIIVTLVAWSSVIRHSPINDEAGEVSAEEVISSTPNLSTRRSMNGDVIDKISSKSVLSHNVQKLTSPAVHYLRAWRKRFGEGKSRNASQSRRKRKRLHESSCRAQACSKASPPQSQGTTSNPVLPLMTISSTSAPDSNTSTHNSAWPSVVIPMTESSRGQETPPPMHSLPPIQIVTRSTKTYKEHKERDTSQTYQSSLKFEVFKITKRSTSSRKPHVFDSYNTSEASETAEPSRTLQPSKPFNISGTSETLRTPGTTPSLDSLTPPRFTPSMGTITSPVDSDIPDKHVTRMTTHGKVVGRKKSLLNGEVVEYLGVKFAKSTAGSQRFAEPAPPEPWKVLHAFSFGPSCYQPQSSFGIAEHQSRSNMSEDCLNLNIWTPTCPSSGGCSPWTTMVYFHGGDLRRGSNAMLLYDGSVLSILGNVVVVVPNYRLGVFGFPSRDVSSSRNLGFLDLVAAVQWVRDNAVEFGGRIDRIVLFGQDWGSYAVGLFLVSPVLKSRFNITRAILSGGSSLLRCHAPNTNFEWHGFLDTLGCAPKDDMKAITECLRNATPAELIRAQEHFPGSVGLLFGDYILPEDPAQFMSESRRHSNVEALLSNTAKEGLVKYREEYGANPKANITIESLLNAVGDTAQKLNYYEHLILQKEVQKHYKFHRASSEDLAVQFLGDVLYNCATTMLAQRLCRGNAAGVAHVVIVHGPKTGSGPGHHLKGRGSPEGGEATHSDDVPFVFGLFLSDSFPTRNMSSKNIQEDRRYSRTLIKIWTDFAKHGSRALLPGISGFCGKTSGGTSMLIFRDHTAPARNWRYDTCSFLNKYFMFLKVSNPGLLDSLQRYRGEIHGTIGVTGEPVVYSD